MMQHPVDLLPDQLRARTLAGARTGRCITHIVIAVIILVLATTYLRIDTAQTRQMRDTTRTQADFVLATEARAAELRTTIRQVNHEIARYHEIALPLPISGVMATLVNRLPEGMTLETMTLDAAPRRGARAPRTRSAIDRLQEQSRVLTGEISGFASTDDQITALVDELSSLPPFRNVNLDFTRSRSVREYSAREFRISFQIDLDERYDVSPAPVAVVDE